MRFPLFPYYTGNRLLFALHSSPANYEKLIEPLCFNGSCSALTCTGLPLGSRSKQMSSIWSWSYCAWKSQLGATRFFLCLRGAGSMKHCSPSLEVQTGHLANGWDLRDRLTTLFRLKDLSFAWSLQLKSSKTPPDVPMCILSVFIVYPRKWFQEWTLPKKPSFPAWSPTTYTLN